MATPHTLELMTTTNETDALSQEAMRCCKLADVDFLKIHNGFLYFRRKEGFTNVLCVPMREATPLRLMLEICMNTQHVREIQTSLAATSSPAQLQART